MIRVGIIGATGYTAAELLKILLYHPDAQVTRLTTREDNHPNLGDVHPLLRNQYDLRLIPFELEDFARNVDCGFCCLPHAASAEVVRQLLEYPIKVIDFSADYRLNDQATFEHWYQVSHPDRERLGSVPYGIPEFFRESIQTARLVANPGCFPTSALLPLVPLIEGQLIETSPIIIDSKTGVSGAGRKPNLKFHFPECNESVAPYGIGTHRHKPEIDQLLGRITGEEIDCVFSPHLIPMERGILSTIYVKSRAGNRLDDLMGKLRQYYQREPFVRIVDSLPTTRDVSGTNFCDITVRESGEMMVILSAIDNLVKGASGAAVQNFNLMFGLPESTALGLKR